MVMNTVHVPRGSLQPLYRHNITDTASLFPVGERLSRKDYFQNPVLIMRNAAIVKT